MRLASKIVIVTGAASLIGLATASLFAAQGAAVLPSTAMAIDHAREGIRVNCICPGPVETPLRNREINSTRGRTS